MGEKLEVCAECGLRWPGPLAGYGGCYTASRGVDIARSYATLAAAAAAAPCFLSGTNARASKNPRGSREYRKNGDKNEEKKIVPDRPFRIE